MDASSRRVLALLERSGALTPRSIARALGIPRSHGRSLRRTLQELVRDRKIARLAGGRYGPVGEGREIEGRLVRDRRGRGSVGSVPIAPEEIRSLGQGDRIRVRLEESGGALRARVVEVIERARPLRIGIVERQRGEAWVLPYRDRRYWEIRLSPSDARRVADGEVVVVEALSEGPGPGAGRLLHSLGQPGSRDVDVQAVAAAHEIPIEFSEDALLEAAERAALGVPEEEVARREDLRGERLVTIDGEDARDFDDAVSVSRLPDGRYRLVVAIADVSYYVAPGTALDREAFGRGNSVYFPDRAIPMLPGPLSADICSLRPDVDRLAMSVDLVVDREGRWGPPRFRESVIRSRARMTYEEVGALLDGACPEWLRPFEELTRILIQRREREGSIDFDLPEPRVTLDSRGEVVDIGARERTLAHRMIEEFMLAANRAVADRLVEARRGAVYRVHEGPEPEHVEALVEMFGALGIPLRDVGAPQIAAALRRLAGRPERHALHFMMLRAMKQARYSRENKGHFALNFDRYLHFTSPIRRYADLVVHRILKAVLSGQAPPEADLAAVADRTSERERAAQDAERVMVDIYRAEFMERYLGDVFEGMISGVSRAGLFVTLERFFVEGLVPLSTLTDYYDLDGRGLALVGRRSGERFALGNRVSVRVDAVDPQRLTVTLGLADRDPPSPRRRGGRRGRPRRV